VTSENDTAIPPPTFCVARSSMNRPGCSSDSASNRNAGPPTISARICVS
jgi:hypothetical protein